MKKLLTKIKQKAASRHQKFYRQQNRWWLVHIVVDFILLVIVILMLASDFSLYLNRPTINLSGYFVAPDKIATTTQAVIKNKYPLPQPELNFKALAQYTLPEGDQIGLGPLPLQIGEATRYWIFFSVSAANSDFSNLQAEGSLGKNVRFTGRTFNNSPYLMDYDNDNGQLSWGVEKIEVANLLPLISAVEVELIPDDSQAKTNPTLIGDIKIQAKTETNGKLITKRILSILADKVE